MDERIGAAARAKGVPRLDRADDLQIARRIALALHGRVPSLEEIRWIEQQPSDARIPDYVDRLLADRRFGDFFAERLASSFVTTVVTDLPFPYRRPSFTRWLSDQLNENEPYDKIVRAVISADGLWGYNGAANFITAFDCKPEALAAQTARSFLGLTIECAQCHDHPYAPWKQSEFHGLAAYFAGSSVGWSGVSDAPRKHTYERRGEKAFLEAPPRPPFAASMDPGDGSIRARLAEWVVNEGNPYFAPASANRIWKMMFGLGLVEPITDLGKPESVPGVLEVLSSDFKAHGHDVRRMIRIIVSTDAFQRESLMHASGDWKVETAFAAFPVTRLRSGQLASAISQTSSTATMDDTAWIATRGISALDEFLLIGEIGDQNGEESLAQCANLSERLTLMNVPPWREQHGLNVLDLADRLSLFAATPGDCVESAFLACLTRRPSEIERKHFQDQLAKAEGKARTEGIEDMIWSLRSSSEFRWNH